VAKCVVCSKSSGPFHSLHKTCLPEYQNTRKCLRETFTDYIAAAEFSADSYNSLNACKPSDQFSQIHFKELFIKAWQEEAKLAIKDAAPNLLTAKKLVDLAEKFDVDDEDVDGYLFTRLSNVEHLERIQNKKPLDVSLDAPAGIELSSSEAIVWKFKKISKNEQERFSQEKQWTVVKSVLNNVLMKSRYKELAISTEEAGMLVVTNQGLHYKKDQAVRSTRFSEIHSVTPMKHGVRIQASTIGAMPDTYVTGDGRFTYALLQYAQGLNDN